MRVVIVTSIYPPEIGGPATHAFDLRKELVERGHHVRVVAGTGVADGPYIPRRSSWFFRAFRLVSWLIRYRETYDVIYATGLQEVAALAAHLAGKPLVIKFVADRAWERATRRGWTESDFVSFAESRPRDLRVKLVRFAQARAARAADKVFVPSEQLSRTAPDWLGYSGHIDVIPNGVALPEIESIDGSRSPGPLRAIVVGRIVEVKRIDMIVDAIAQTDSVELTILGDGPERSRLAELVRRRGLEKTVRLTGSLPIDRTRRLIGEADVMVQASLHEGMPHSVLEALAHGVPLIVSSAPGLSNLIQDGVNGIVIENMTSGKLAATLSDLRDDESALARLRHGALDSREKWSFESTADRIEATLESAVEAAKPKAVFIGSTRISPDSLVRNRAKYAVLERHFNPIIVSRGPLGRRRDHGIRRVELSNRIAGFFHILGPIVAVGLAATKRPSVVVCQSPYEAIGCVAISQLLPSRIRPLLMVEAHGDWFSATRMYGSRWRRFIIPISDRAAHWAILKADRCRAVSAYTASLLRSTGFAGTIDVFPAFTELDRSRPSVSPPANPRILYAGALELAKGVDILIEAWPEVSRSVPGAQLTIAGSGTMRSEVERRIEALGLRDSVSLVGSVDHQVLLEEMDRSRCIVVPSRTEGLSRVILEAMSRGRGVVASAAGGITELVGSSETGLLVPPDEPAALARALVEVVTRPGLAESLGEAAIREFEEMRPDIQFCEGVAKLASWVAGEAS